MTFNFRVLKTHSATDPEGQLNLIGNNPMELIEAVNKLCEAKVLEPCGEGLGLNAKLVDKNLWSMYISAHVSEKDEDGCCTLEMPTEKIARTD